MPNVVQLKFTTTLKRVYWVDERKVYGQYIVGLGKDFRVKQNQAHYGFDKTLIPDAWYIVHITGKVLGCYTDEFLATNLAKGLDKRDQKRLSDEMDKILRNEQRDSDG